MEITHSQPTDIATIFELYRIATAYMKSKNQVSWPEFEHDLISKEIEEKRQWKMVIEDVVACIWATTRNDEILWGKQNNIPSLYIHRIATNPDFRGQNLVKHMVDWADKHCKQHDLQYVRMDTVGYNEGLIAHYTKLGFQFLGTKELQDTSGLPKHYEEGPVCFFQREVPH